jgi:Short C-terminal domain
MSLTNELQKLKSLRDSGVITPVEFEKQRNRLLEECVRHIEAVHDLNPKAAVSGQPNVAQHADGEPRVKFSRVETRQEVNRPSEYSGELDYSLVKPPVRRTPDVGAATAAVAPARVEFATPAPRMDSKPEPGYSIRTQTTRFVDAPRTGSAAALQTPVARAAETSANTIAPPVRVEEERPAAPSWGVPAQRVEVSFSPRGAVLDVKEPARRIEVFEKEEAPANAIGAEVGFASQSNVREDFVPRFDAFYNSKPSGRDRWGLPRFKLVRGEVQDMRVLMCGDSESYAASIEVDGQRMAITSKSEIRIANGDRISLGGYERDGELLVLAYRNETNGSYSDLSSLRKRYRLLLTIGRLSLLIGLAALAATVMAFLHRPGWAVRFDHLGFMPYLLSALAAAALAYLGLTLSFVGRWAKEFHNALAPADSSSERAAYNASSLPLTQQ